MHTWEGGNESQSYLCQVCLLKCRFAKTSWRRTCFVKYAWWSAVLQKQAEREHALSLLSSMPGEMPFCENKLKENMLCQTLSSMPGEMSFLIRFAKTSWKRTCFVIFCQVCLVKCRFAKTNWKRTCFIKYAWWNAFLQNTLKENVLCQVCLVKCRFATTNWKRTCFVIFVKNAWWNVVSQKRAEGEHALSSMPEEVQCCKNKLKENMLCQTLSSMPGEMPFWSVLQKQAEKEHVLSFLSSMPGEMPFCENKLKENMLCQALSSMPGEMPFCQNKLKENMFCHICQVCLVKSRFPKQSWKRACFVKYAWWNAVLQKQVEREHVCQVCLVKCLFAKASWKRTCFVKYAWWNAVLRKQAEREHVLSNFVKYAWWNVVSPKQAAREHALSSIPDGMPVCKSKLKENMFVKYAWWNAVLQKQTEREHALSSMPGEVQFCKNKLKESMLCHCCQVCLVKCRFAKTSWKRTCFVKLCQVCLVKCRFWSVLQKQAEREHALSSLSSMPGEMPFCKISSKRACFVKYAWWNAVLQHKLKENVLCQVCNLNAVLQKQAEREHAWNLKQGWGWSRRCQGQNADQGGLNPTVTQLPPGTWPSNEKSFLPPIWPYFCTFATVCPPDPLNSLRSH